MWSFHLRAVLTLTPNSLKEETCSIVNPFYRSGRYDSLNLAGSITISLVFFQLIVIKLNSDHLLTELRRICILDCCLLQLFQKELCRQQIYVRGQLGRGHLLEIRNRVGLAKNLEALRH